MGWPAKTPEEIRRAVFAALAENGSYTADPILGYPGSVLDPEVFPPAEFLTDAPFLTCLRENPNHIGVHTDGASEGAFRGTQALEREALRLCAEELLRAAPGTWDGYVATGGTEANIQGMWALRNGFRRAGAGRDEVAVLHSSDAHYSVVKGADLLDLPRFEVPVHPWTRRMTPEGLARTLDRVVATGQRRLVVLLTMGTTMFGSVDALDPVAEALEARELDYAVHVDAAFGGFVYPLTRPDQPLALDDPRVASLSLDAHKMLQAPYGTGVFLCRKGVLDAVRTPEARYVPGGDATLCGSRSGAQAVALWMILQTYGSAGGEAFLAELMERTDHLVAGLRERRVRAFREPGMNVVALPASAVPRTVAEAFRLVPDRHAGTPRWWKVVVMHHVTRARIDELLRALGPPSPGRRGIPAAEEGESPWTSPTS